MYERYAKRVLDVLVASVALSTLLIPFLLILLWIRLDSKGPAIFKQLRFGKNKQQFTVYKFRTMAMEAPANMPTSNFKQAGSYITRAGRIMRKLSIDELPQLVNVLKGDMSIVGPRPVVLAEKNLLRERAKYRALSAKPGITGWAQVNGRDELDDIIKARLDGWYVDNIGLKTDTRIIIKTIWVIASVAGHVEGHESTEKHQLEGVGE